MKNADCEPSRLPEPRVARQHGTQAQTTALSPHDEAMRDFFRRGDRGQYEGGPADHRLESPPDLEVTERAPAVRTPQQQARRLALIRFEAVLLAGCLGFLVAAARSNSSVTSELQGTSAAQIQPLQRSQPIAQPLAATAGPLKARAQSPPAASATMIVPKVMPVAQVQAPTLAEAPHAITGAKFSTGAANAGKVVQIRSETPKVTSSVQHQRPAKVALASKPEPTSPTRSVAQRAAVGTFPED